MLVAQGCSMRNVSLLSVFLAVCGAFSPAFADPVTLTGSSSLALDIESDGFRFVGASFDLTGEKEFQVPIPRVHDPGCGPCFTGDLVNLGFRTTGEVNLGTGHGTIDGVAYPALAFTGSLRFTTTPTPLPEPPPDSFGLVPFSSPFQFTGFVRAFAGGNEVFARELRGRGTASHDLVLGPDELPPWHFAEDATRFTFADPTPVPEPSTLALVGLGTLALSRVRRARRQIG